MSLLVVAAAILGGAGLGLGALGLVPATLGWLGFGAAGPVAGTFAATAQAGIGNVVAGSMFAWAQSLAMVGLGIGAWVGAGVIGAIGGLFAAFR